MDFSMPVLDGMEATKEILKEIRPYALSIIECYEAHDEEL